MAPLDAPDGVTRPIVFFDINIGDTAAGRIKMGAYEAPLFLSSSILPLRSSFTIHLPPLSLFIQLAVCVTS